jgi:hypothetical protein
MEQPGPAPTEAAYNKGYAEGRAFMESKKQPTPEEPAGKETEASENKEEEDGYDQYDQEVQPPFNYGREGQGELKVTSKEESPVAEVIDGVEFVNGYPSGNTQEGGGEANNTVVEVIDGVEFVNGYPSGNTQEAGEKINTESSSQSSADADKANDETLFAGTEDGINPDILRSDNDSPKKVENKNNDETLFAGTEDGINPDILKNENANQSTENPEQINQSKAAETEDHGDNLAEEEHLSRMEREFAKENPENDNNTESPQEDKEIENLAEEEHLSRMEREFAKEDYRASTESLHYVKEATDKYVKALSQRRRLFGRISEESLRAARDEYNDAHNRAIAETLRNATELGTVEKAALCALLIDKTVKEREDLEVILSNEGFGKKALNWLKANPKARFAIGVALGAGTIASASTGAIPLTMGFVAARAAWQGANTAIAAEAGMDYIRDKINFKKMSDEDIIKLSEFGVREELSKRIARSINRGQQTEKTSDKETIDALREANLQLIRERLTKSNDSAAEVKIILDTINERNEEHQRRERRSSIHRWSAGIAIGALVGAYSFNSGMEKLGTNPVSPEKGPDEIIPATANPEIGSGAGEFVSDQMASKGDGIWHMARRAVGQYGDHIGGLDLTESQKIVAIDYLKDKVVSEGLPGVGIGNQPNWVNIGFKYSFDKQMLQSAVEYAKSIK